MFVLPSQTAELTDLIYEDIIKYKEIIAKYIKEEHVGYFSGRDWEYSIVAKLSNFTDTDIILDVGGAHSSFLFMLSYLFDKGYIVDIGKFWRYEDWFKVVTQYTETITGKVIIVRTDAINLPFKDNFFDKVVTISALEHFIGRDDILVAKEINRVLKPGGTFYGTVDFSPLNEFSNGTDPIIGSKTYTYNSFESRILQDMFIHEYSPIKITEFPDTSIIAPLFFTVRK